MSTTGSQSVDEYLASVGSRSSTPGGGAVAAVAVAEACALLEMVFNFTKPGNTKLDGMLERLQASRTRLPVLADRDMQAFDKVMRAYRGDDDLQSALADAAAIPVAVMEICESHLEDARLLAEVGNRNLVTDIAIAASLLSAGLDACEVNVLVNVKSMNKNTDDLKARLNQVPLMKQQLTEILNKVKSELS